MLYALAAVFALLGTALCTLVDRTPAGLVYFPDNDADIIFPAGSAAIFVVAVVAHVIEARRS